MAFAVWLVAGPVRAADAPATQPELRPILSPEARREAARGLIDRFVAHVNGSPSYDPAAKAAVADGWRQHRGDEEPAEFLIAGLAIISPEFKAALADLEHEDYAKALPALAALTKAEDPYLALNAAVLRGRTLVEQEQMESAEPVLKSLVDRRADLMDKSFAEAEVDFLLAFAQLSTLQYEPARESLELFERLHPDAPDHYRLPARQMLQELRARQPDGLGDVSDLMVYAGRRLGVGEPGKPVQMKQDRAVELLKKLIDEAEEREKQSRQQGGGGKSGRPRGYGQPNSPANRSMLPGGKSEIGPLGSMPPVRPGEEWGKMRPEDRERILQSLRRSFPSRYRQLVEQYYKQLGKEK